MALFTEKHPWVGVFADMADYCPAFLEEGFGRLAFHEKELVELVWKYNSLCGEQTYLYERKTWSFRPRIEFGVVAGKETQAFLMIGLGYRSYRTRPESSFYSLVTRRPFYSTEVNKDFIQEDGYTYQEYYPQVGLGLRRHRWSVGTVVAYGASLVNTAYNTSSGKNYSANIYLNYAIVNRWR